MPPTSSRLDIVDALRGFAIVSIMLLHNLEHFDLYHKPAGQPEPEDVPQKPVTSEQVIAGQCERCGTAVELRQKIRETSGRRGQDERAVSADAGAVERVAKAGIKNIGLIHRGFSSYGNTEYRNAPMWHLAIEMKRRNPEMLIINDPSHICGRRDILMDVAQKAIDLDFDGLMIESHIDPDNAWSDAKQQITPERLKEMLDAIIWRKEDVNSDEYHAALEKLRQQINHLTPFAARHMAELLADALAVWHDRPLRAAPSARTGSTRLG